MLEPCMCNAKGFRYLTAQAGFCAPLHEVQHMCILIKYELFHANTALLYFSFLSQFTVRLFEVYFPLHIFIAFILRWHKSKSQKFFPFLMYNTNSQIKKEKQKNNIFLKTENLLYATDIVTKQKNNSNQDRKSNTRSQHFSAKH